MINTPLAWLNLLHSKLRTLVALMGVSFAVVLMFLQLGFLGAVEKTATMIYDELKFDVLIRSAEYLHFADARTFPAQRLKQIESDPGVLEVVPFYVEVNEWRRPLQKRKPKSNDEESVPEGYSRGILLMGVRAGDNVFRVPEIQSQMPKLTRPDFLLIDRKSRREFGPQNGLKFSDEDLEIETEIGGNTVRIVGHFALGTGLAADGAVVLSDRGFSRIYQHRDIDDLNMGLVRTDADPNDLVESLRKVLPSDVEVLTRAEVLRRERDRWVAETSVGLIFQMGVVVSLLVGIAIVYQVLATDVANHMAEYATLKAMGYRNSFLSGIVLRQALALSIVGFFPGWAVAAILYQVTAYMANLPISMTLARSGAVLLLTIIMCTISGLAALRKLQSAEPANLF